MEFWKIIRKELANGAVVGLLYTLDSIGSSPGRQGFKMLVSESGLLFGSIGGGMMEYNLVEETKTLILKNTAPAKFRLVHRINQEDASGLICSGEQTVAMYPLAQKDITWVEQIIQSKGDGILQCSDKGIHFSLGKKQKEPFICQIDAEQWLVTEDIGYQPVLHIIGGGHVGLALSKLAPEIGFMVKVYDDRKNLNTFDSNPYGEIIPVDSFTKIGELIPEGHREFVVIMSFMFDTDKLILSQLLIKVFKYLGMMGSRKKVKTLLKELKEDGFSQEQIQQIHAPIGIQIASQTPSEIAISILAELISIKNA